MPPVVSKRSRSFSAVKSRIVAASSRHTAGRFALPCCPVGQGRRRHYLLLLRQQSVDGAENAAADVSDHRATHLTQLPHQFEAQPAHSAVFFCLLRQSPWRRSDANLQDEGHGQSDNDPQDGGDSDGYQDARDRNQVVTGSRTLRFGGNRGNERVSRADWCRMGRAMCFQAATIMAERFPSSFRPWAAASGPPQTCEPLTVIRFGSSQIEHTLRSDRLLGSNYRPTTITVRRAWIDPTGEDCSPPQWLDQRGHKPPEFHGKACIAMATGSHGLRPGIRLRRARRRWCARRADGRTGIG
jgi:hypothetical protein